MQIKSRKKEKRGAWSPFLNFKYKGPNKPHWNPICNYLFWLGKFQMRIEMRMGLSTPYDRLPCRCAGDRRQKPTRVKNEKIFKLTF